MHKGKELPASYLNFLITNGKVIVPAYGQDKDVKAANIVQELFPEREIISLDCQSFLQEGGAIHCLTMNQS